MVIWSSSSNNSISNKWMQEQTLTRSKATLKRMRTMIRVKLRPNTTPCKRRCLLSIKDRLMMEPLVLRVAMMLLVK